MIITKKKVLQLYSLIIKTIDIFLSNKINNVNNNNDNSNNNSNYIIIIIIIIIIINFNIIYVAKINIKLLFIN